MSLEFFHTFVVGPRSLEIRLASVPKLLPLLLTFSLSCLFGEGLALASCCLFADLSNVQAGCDSSAVSWIHRQTCVVKLDPLVVEARDVELRLLDESRHMVLLSVKECLTLKPSGLVLHLGDLKLRYVNFWSEGCLGWLHAA